MSIVHRVPDMPRDGTLVHARGKSDMFKDRDGQHIERAVYRDGKFSAGGDFPIRAFELHDVDMWVYQDDIRKPSTGEDVAKLFEEADV